MSDTGYRRLRQWVSGLSPNAIFLLTFFGSAVAAAIVSWIPYASVKTIAIGIGLCLNAGLMAWLSRVRTLDNQATIRERAVLLQQVKKLKWVKEQQQASLDAARQSQPREQPSQPISGLEKSQPNVAGLVSRTEVEDLTTSPRWNVGDEDAHKQWKLVSVAEHAMVRFVLVRGTATATQLLQFRGSDGFRSTDTGAAVKEKTSFLSGDLQSGLAINPRLKPYLEKMMAEDKRRGVRAF